jgi:hypothetical protein
MAIQSITPKRLIRDSLISVIPIYKPLLILYIPSLIVSLLKFVIPELLFSIVGTLYYLSIGSIFFGATIVFCYKKLNKEEITIYQSLKKALEKFPELLFLNILKIFLLPLLILFPRFYFLLSLVLIKNLPIADVFKRCWQMTKGYGWQIFWNLVMLKLISDFLHFLPSLVSASIFGFNISVWDINREESSIATSALIINRLLTIATTFFCYYPFSIVYIISMFTRLLSLEKINLNSVRM